MDADALHAAACARGERTYTDPRSGWSVFTAVGLEARGECCGSGCRHCPYGHEQVGRARRSSLLADPWLAEDGGWGATPCDVLSWSGGKDSLLALSHMLAEGARPVVLLSTHHGPTGKVAHQEVHADDLRRQARALGLPLVLVPLASDADYVRRVEQGLARVGRNRPIRRFAFGDLHLRHVRAWREEALAPLVERSGLSLHFPLWDLDYGLLMAVFEASGARATVSNVASPGLEATLQVGEPFGPGLVARLPDGIDAFGEQGEFHTLVEPPTPAALAAAWLTAAEPSPEGHSTR